MRTLTINIPENTDLDDREVIMYLASRLYEKGKLSLGQAAEMAGPACQGSEQSGAGRLSKRAFMEILGQYDVSIFNYDPSELEEELKHVKKYRK